VLVRQLARYLHAAGRSAAAVTLVTKAAAAHPDEPAYALVVAGTLRELGRADEAEATLHQAVAHFAQSEAVALALADTLIRANRGAEGVAVYEAFLKRSQETPDRLYTLSHLQARIDQPRAAAATLRRVLELLPSHAGAANDLGYYYADMNEQLSTAEALVSQALDAVPNSAAFVDSLGWVYYKRGQMDQAVLTLRRATELPGGDQPDVLRHLADALYRAGRTLDAQESWQRARNELENTPQGLSVDERAERAYLDRVLQESRQGQRVSVTPTAREAATQPARS
jgi:tetratricopeptide (TPR) repeat protein